MLCFVQVQLSEECRILMAMESANVAPVCNHKDGWFGARKEQKKEFDHRDY